jgi:hypothetical protein
VQSNDPIRVEDFVTLREAEDPESGSPVNNSSDAGYPFARVVELARQLQDLAATGDSAGACLRCAFCILYSLFCIRTSWQSACLRCAF